MCKVDGEWEVVIWHRELSLMLCDDLEGQDGGRESQKGGAKCILMADSHCHRVCMCAKLLQSCRTLCNPMDCSLPGFSVRGILQARIPECVAISSSRRSF